MLPELSSPLAYEVPSLLHGGGIGVAERHPVARERPEDEAFEVVHNGSTICLQ
jgi:hypothetical protein